MPRRAAAPPPPAASRPLPGPRPLAGGLAAAAAGALLLAAGCAPKVAPGRGGEAAGGVNIPPGCEAPLGGEWLHAAAPTWRYLGEDDGGSLVLTVSRVRSDGGTGAPGEGGPRVELRRTAEGFVGQVQDSTFGPGDTRCAVRFPTQVVACAPDRLTLSTAARAFVDEQCNPAPQAGPARQDVHELVRPPPGAPPAASPAASPPPGASAPPAPVASPAPDAGTP